MAKDEMVAPVVEKPAIVFDFSGWKQRDKREFILVQNQNDDALIYPYIARSVVSWPYPLDPKSLDSYDELGIDEFREVGEQFVLALKKRLGQS